MGGGKFVRLPKPESATVTRSANLVYPNKRKKKGKPAVASSFKEAYHRLAPSKEIRYNLINATMEPLTSMATRTGSIYVDNIAQGPQMNQRLQNSVFASYIHINGTVQHNSALKARMLRLMLVREINNSGISTTTYAGLYKNIGTAALAPTGNQSDMQWPINRELAYVIFDKKFKLLPEERGILNVNIKHRVGKIYKYTPDDGVDSTPYHGRTLLIANVADCDGNPTATTSVLNLGIRIFFKDHTKGRY